MSQPTPGPDDGLESVQAPADAFRVALPNFEGPLDLLLHLIREHRLDLFDIPIALITSKYLAHLELMREIDLDIAGEFLVMASTLLHLKSRMLLPREDVPGEIEGKEEQGDPRAELVHRLLEYQKYKDAADQLFRQDLLDRDVFPRRVSVDRVPLDADEIGVREISVFKLIEALDRVLKALEPKRQHEVVREYMSLSEAMGRRATRLKSEQRVSFFSLFAHAKTRGEVIITFLALLEMCKLKLLRVTQDAFADDIWISAKGDSFSSLETSAVEEAEREYV